MDTPAELWRKLTFFFRRGQSDRDLDEEMRHHVAMKAEAYLTRQEGMSSGEARNAAHREFGNTLLLRERSRDTWGFVWLETLVQDLRYGLRMLRKSPGFTAVAILTLTLGISANTALFSVVNGVLLNPLPYPHPNQLVSVASMGPDFGQSSISYPDYLDWVSYNTTLSSLAAYRQTTFNLFGQGEPEHVSAMEVSATFFPILGVTPILGRNFSATEDQLNGPPVVILSAGFWKTKFASSSDIVGKALNLDGSDYTVVGVLPATFYFCCKDTNFHLGDVYLPIGADMNPWMKTRKVHPGIWGVGRIKQGVTLAQARADMDRVARNLAAAYPDIDKDLGIGVTPLKQEMVQNIQPFLLVLLAAVGFVLLIACVNVANLLLARSSARSREFAIRAALGASQGRVIRQLLTESVLIALVGGALGLLLAAWGTSAALTILPSSLPRAGDVRIDPRVLLFTLIIRQAVQVFNSKAVVFDTESMDHMISQSLAARRFTMILLAVFAGLALLLSSIGIYGVISYVVGQRTHEIGIRMALGAQRSDVLKIVLSQTASLALVGVLIGLAASVGLTRLMTKVIYGVSALDPVTFISVAVVLTLAALAACYIPARRAMRVDPIIALRYE